MALEDDEFLSEVNRWLSMLETFLRGDLAEDDDGRFRAIEAREWRELLEDFKEGNATVRQLRDFFEDASYLPELEGWNDYQQDILQSDIFQAPRTWDEIEDILRRNGYSENEIQDVKNSINTNGVLQGSTVIPGILADLGYEGGDWWDVRPTSGQPCTTDDNKTGKYNADGDCIPDKYQEGDKCPTVPNGPLDGVIKDGQCVSGDDVGDDGGDDDGCSVITQENADECGYEITSDGQLVPKDLDGDPEDYPNYKSCGGGIFVLEDAECPDLEGTGGTEGDPCTIDGEEGTIQDGVCVPTKTFEDYVNEVGEDIANAAKDIYNEMKDVLTECVDSPLDCIKKIGDVLAEQGIPEKCRGLVSCDIAKPDEGSYCWKDCVNFQVLAGLPIPIPSLPGMQDIGTYRDFEDFLKGIGKSIDDFFEDPAGTLEDWGKGIIDKIKDVFSDAQDVDANEIIDWLKGIFGAAVGAWVWGQIEDELSVIFPFTTIDDCPEDVSEINADNFEKCGYKDCGGGKYVKKEESCDEVIEEFDCSTVNRQGGIVQSEDQCGECLESFDEDADGDCIEKETPVECEGPTAQECTDLHKEHIPCTDVADASCGGCLEGYKAEGDNCVKDDGEVPDDGTYDPVCTEPRPTGQLTFALEEQQAAWDQKCRATHCESGVPISEDPDCYGPPPGQTCDNNAVNAPDCNQCENGESPDQHIDGDCNKDLKNIDGTEGQCPADSERDGQNPLYDGRDTNKSGFFTTPSGITYTYEPCNPSLGFSIVGQDVNVCEDQNNLNYGNIVQQPEEPCGDCKSGFDKPEGYDTCVSIVDVLCKDDNVSGNYEECGTEQPPEETNCAQQGKVTNEDGSCGGCDTEKGYVLSELTGRCYIPPEDDCTDDAEGNPRVRDGFGRCVPIGSECRAESFGGQDCRDPETNAYQFGVIDADGSCVCPGDIEQPPEEPCPDFNGVEGPRDDQGNCYDCTDEANAMVCGWAECPEGGMAPTLEDCFTIPEGCYDAQYAQDNPKECGLCEDPDYAQANPEACDYQPPIPLDCDDPQYAQDNPKECGLCEDFTYAQSHPLECGWEECPNGSFAPTREECTEEPLECENGATDYPTCTVCPEGQSMDAEGNCVPDVEPPPATGGGGGGGMLGGGSFAPFLAGISYTPQAVPEPPAPAQKDYTAELDNLIKRSLFEGMA